MDHPDDDGLGLDAPLGMEEKPVFSTFEKAAGQLALDIAGALCKFAKEFGYSPEEALFPKVKKGRKGNNSSKHTTERGGKIEGDDSILPDGQWTCGVSR